MESGGVTEVPQVTGRTPEAQFFAPQIRDYVRQCVGRPVSLLHAGYVSPLDELGLEVLRERGFEIQVAAVDEGRRPGPDDNLDEEAPADLASLTGLTDLTVGDLRTIPLPPRAFDIVHCALLLHRIKHVPLVLDRLGATLRPGGLLLLRIRDRDCAAGFLDRGLPGPIRKAVWTRLYPGQPGPFPAVYERTASDRGIAAYMLMRGLVITHRRTARTLPAKPVRLSRCVGAARALIAALSRRRLNDRHDEVLFVIRKPEDRFARVV